MATAAPTRRLPEAPPVYRPQSTPFVQRKACDARGANQTKVTPPSSRIVPQAQTARPKPSAGAAPSAPRQTGSAVIQRRVTLKFINETIQDANPEQIRKWLRDNDKINGSSYEAEVKSHAIYETALAGLTHSDEDLTYGFLQASEFMARLRTTGKNFGKALARTNNLVFGLSGKTEKQIWDAILSGYRKFDCAESYGQTTDILASILARTTEIARPQIKIYYKFDINPGESENALRQRLLKPLDQFGYLDALIIHNFDDALIAPMGKAWEVMTGLKGEGKVKKIGLGNIDGNQYQILNKFEGIDVVENSLASVLTNDATQAFVDMNGAELLVYHVVDAANEAGLNDDVGIKTMLKKLGGLKASPIMSSGSSKTQLRNAVLFGEKPKNYQLEDAGHAKKLGDWLSASHLCAANDDYNPPASVKVALEVIHAKQAEMRADIQTHVQNITAEEMRKWFVETFKITLGDYNLTKLPRRKGMNKMYVGKTVGEILAKLFGKDSCGNVVGAELLQVLLAGAGDWDAFLCLVSPRITK